MMRIVLCDDHGIVREGVKAVLQTIPGAEVVAEAVSGEDLAQRLGAVKFDLALIDVSMDGMDGITLATRIRSAQPGARVMALTFHRDPGTVRAFLATGAEGYLLKDEPPGRIREAVEQVMAGRRFISAEIASVLVSSWQSGPDPEDRPGLTRREQEVLRLLFRGMINKEIAADQGLSVKTVEKTRASLMHKSGTRTAAELSAWAIRTGWASG